MKFKFILLLVPVFLLVNGCVNNLETIPLNIPLEQEIALSGSGSMILGAAEFCIDDSLDLFQEYKEDIKSYNLLEIALRTTLVDPSELAGDIYLLASSESGDEIFELIIPDLTPDDFLIPNQPYIVNLSKDDLRNINEYLNSQDFTEGICFGIAVYIRNIVPETGDKEVNMIIDLVIEAEIEL